MKKELLLVGFSIFSVLCFSQGKNPDSWKLAVQAWTFHRYSFIETVERAASLGIPYIEAYPGQQLGGEMPGKFDYRMEKDEREKIKQFLRYNKVKVIAMGVLDKYSYTKENLADYFEFARYMGISYITAEPEWADLDEFNRLAARYKVKVALHCHPKPASHYWHPDSMLLAIKNRPNIGAWPDLGHWARSGVDVLPAIKRMKGKLWGMHFKDIREFDKPDATDTLFGMGVCNLPEVMKEMKRQGFRGVVSMEYEVHEQDNMEDLKKCILFYEGERKRLSAL